jgi:hypothetical protein
MENIRNGIIRGKMEVQLNIIDEIKKERKKERNKQTNKSYGMVM